MPTRQFAFERGGVKRVALTWTGIWKRMVVSFDGRELGVIEDKAALEAGRSFALDDGTTLKVQLVRAMRVELQVMRDGTPLPGSDADPEERLKAAWGTIVGVAGLSALLGVLATAFDVEFLARMGFGVESLAEAGILAGLGFLVQRFRSGIALGLAVGLFALDGVFAVAEALTAGVVPFGGIAIRVALLLVMCRGFPAIQALNERDRPATAIPPGMPRDPDPWERAP